MSTAHHYCDSSLQPGRSSRRRHRWIAVAVVGSLLTIGSSASAALAGPRSPDAANSTTSMPAAVRMPGKAQPASDPGSMAAYFDSALPGRLRTDHLPGATVSVVHGADTVVSKGYGIADVAAGTPFDPATSLIRIASISKLFTWTAVMQQVQAGRIDLNENVNHYLRTFQIPDTYSRPITMLDLMDHTAGFEDHTIGIAARSKKDVPELEEYLAQHVPARIRPPGEISAYSNYGAALAGYIVAEVSGQPYEHYLQQHLLDPLGMTHSTGYEPVPASLPAKAAASYNYENGVNRKVPFTFDKLGPDGSISTTADDMARFMSAHLRDGQLDGRQILDPGTARLMHRHSFGADPRIGGYAHGFMEKTINGHRVIMHDGSWEGFLSMMVLVPDEQLAVFIATNSNNGVDAVTDVMDGFYDRFVPATTTTAPAAVTPASSSTPATERTGRTSLPGFYQPARHTEATLEKILTLTSQLRLRFDDHGRLLFKGKTWTPVGPNLYQQIGGPDRAAFVTKDSGTYLVTSGATYQQVPRSSTITLNLVVLLVIVLTALVALLGFPLAAAVRRLRKRPFAAPSRWRRARRLAGLAAATGLAFIVLFALTLFGDTSAFLYSVPASFRALLLLPLVTVVLAIAATVSTATAWRKDSIGVLARAHQLTILAGLLSLVWFCWHWNLFGWNIG